MGKFNSIQCSRLIRGIFKIIGIACAIILSPIYLTGGLVASYAGRFADFSLVLGYLPFYFGEYSRLIYYSIFLKKVGKKTVFKFGSYVQYQDTFIGANCLIGFFNSVGQVHMGDNVICGGYINFTSGLRQHSYDNKNIPINKQPGKRICLNIGSDVWIGSNSLICAGIGNRVVIGAGSVVVKDCCDEAVYAGNPAKLIRHI